MFPSLNSSILKRSNCNVLSNWKTNQHNQILTVKIRESVWQFFLYDQFLLKENI